MCITSIGLCYWVSRYSDFHFSLAQSLSHIVDIPIHFPNRFIHHVSWRMLFLTNSPSIIKHHKCALWSTRISVVYVDILLALSMRKEAPIHKTDLWLFRDSTWNEVPNIPIKNCNKEVSSSFKTDIDYHVLSWKYQEKPQAPHWFTSIFSTASAAKETFLPVVPAW